MRRSAEADAAEGRHGFPVALTSFVGRTQAVADVADRLSQGRLVTVTGAGGAGKTRLASEVARRVAGRFADGVWLAELAAVQDPAQVATEVARLDGMPLAIELAAARVDVLGVAQLLERIDDRFELLTDGDRLAEQRQRSLAAAVQWRYRLLDEVE